MTFRFDADTACERVLGRTAAVTVHPEWNVDSRILNGGYLQAVLTRGVQEVLAAGGAPSRQPIAVSASFAAPARPGPAEVEVTALRQGSTLTATSAVLRQGGETVISGLITLAAGHHADADVRAADRPRDSSYPSMPAVTGAGDSLRVPISRLPGPPGLASLIDYAFVPETSGWLAGDLSGGPRIQCWMTFADGRPADALAAVAMVDMAPPICFAQGDFGWAPTVQLQVGVFAAPRPGPLLLEVSGSPYDGPIVAEDGLLWDSAGTLIARSRQIALAPRTGRAAG